MITARLFLMFSGVTAAGVSCHQEPRAPRYERVVMVHGIFEDGVAFNPLRRRLERHGVECFVPQMKPADARTGLEVLAKGLKDEIDAEFGAEDPIAIVAFSMGGLVSRYYLQELGGAERCEQFITISSPHHGTKMAYTYFGEGARQMRPGSQFLRDLEATENILGEMPIISYRTPMDLIIRPTGSPIWERAENRSHVVAMHPLMLHTRTVLDDIEKRLIMD